MGSLINAKSAPLPATREAKPEPTVDKSEETADDMVTRRRRARYGMTNTITAGKNESALGGESGYRKTLG